MSEHYDSTRDRDDADAEQNEKERSPGAGPPGEETAGAPVDPAETEETGDGG